MRFPVRSRRALLVVLGALLWAAPPAHSGMPRPVEPDGAGEMPAAASRDEHVVLVHGLARSPRSMKLFEAYFSNAGLQVTNFGYPSRKGTIEEHAETLDAALRECCSDPGVPVHFLTHSMGGLLLRHYLASHHLPNLGRVVMVAPPNRGSKLANLLPKVPGGEKIAGPSGRQLRTGEKGIGQSLPPVEFDLGIIAGGRSWNPLFSAILPGEDDGLVSVESTRVEGMDGFLLMPHSHNNLKRCAETARQAVHFIEHGSFDPDTGHGELIAPAPDKAGESPVR